MSGAHEITAEDPLFVLVRLLKPLSSDERQRLVQSAMTYLGEGWLPTAPAAVGNASAGSNASGERHAAASGDDDRGIGIKGQKWMKQNGVTGEHLDNLFNFKPDAVDLLVMPGKNKREMTLNSYVLFGLTHFLRTGMLSFSDGDARKVCVEVGCMDSANHATTLNNRGNLFSGDKEGGWTLSAAGLTRAANLIKQYQEPSA